MTEKEDTEDHERTRFYADLEKAIQRRELATVEDLLKDNTFSLDALVNDKYNRCSSTPILLAIGTGRVDMVKLLVSHGASVNFTMDAIGCSPRLPLHRACANGHEEVVRFLLKAGADVDMKDDADLTPLQEAVVNQRAEVASLLLTSGATFDPQLLLKICPVDARSAKGIRRSVLTLLQHGVAASPDVDNEPLDYFWDLGFHDKDTVRLLIECGVKPSPEILPPCRKLINDPVFNEWLTAATNGPLSLKCICAIAIRTHLAETCKRNILEHMLKLPLPTPLIKYLTLDRYEQWASQTLSFYS